MEYNVGEAAKLVRVNKSTILRAIQSGKLSAKRQRDGSYTIDGAELVRVYDLRAGDLPQKDAAGGEAFAVSAADAALTALSPDAVELAVLRERVARFEAEQERWERERETMLGAHRETVGVVDDLRKRLDREQEERRNLQRQLAPPIQRAPQVAQEQSTEAPTLVDPTKTAKGFLARLLGL